MGCIRHRWAPVILLVAFVGCQSSESPTSRTTPPSASSSPAFAAKTSAPRTIRIDLKDNEPSKSVSLAMTVPAHLSEDKLVPVLAVRVNKAVRSCDGATSVTIGLQLNTKNGDVATVKPMTKGKVGECVAAKFERTKDAAFGTGAATFNIRIQPLSAVQGGDDL